MLFENEKAFGGGGRGYYEVFKQMGGVSAVEALQDNKNEKVFQEAAKFL